MEPHNHVTDTNSHYSNDKSCSTGLELFPRGGEEKDTRKHTAVKGEEIHQFTIGASGKETYDICDTGRRETKGDFLYASNKFHGFALVKVSAEEFTVQMKGFYYN